MRRYNWKKILTRSVWAIAGIGAIVLLGAAMQQKSRKACSDVHIEITGAEKNLFIDEKDVLALIGGVNAIQGKRTAVLDLRQMETSVERNPWVRNAEMFIDNNQVLQIRIEERQPVARVFTMDGNSFYLDSGSLRLPLSEKLSARVPVFTGFPSGRMELSKPDSSLLRDIVKIGRFIATDSFWMAQTAQIDITPRAEFEMIPVVGYHIVTLGNADELERKFGHLYTFYRQAWLQNGINTYERLDVQYDNQVVAVRKGTAKAMVDSARAHQLIAELQVQRAVDSVNAAAGATATATVSDSAFIRKPVPPLVKSTAKGKYPGKSPALVNNKVNKKPLTKGKNKTVSKMPKPVAVMKKKS